MAEENEGAASGPEGVGAGFDPVATAMALGGASREDAREYLKKQGALIDDQRHHLHEQLKQLHLNVWEKWLGVGLRAATAVMGLAIAGGLGFMVWQASQSNGLLFEPFSVPPELSARGLTGEVVAAKVLDRLTWMQKSTSSQRPAKTYVNSWSEHDIKLEIPETGVSMAELDRFLRSKLGHDTHVSGEAVRTAQGLTLTARAGEDGAESVMGSVDDMDTLTQRLAESIYRMTQPFRYAMYLTTHHRSAEADPLFQQLAKSSNRDDQMWGLNRWAVSVASRKGNDAGVLVLKEAVALEPDNIGAWTNLVSLQIAASRPEDAVRAGRSELLQLSGKTQTYVLPVNLPGAIQRTQANIDYELGAFADAARTWAPLARTGYPGLSLAQLIGNLAKADTGAHDLAAARDANARLDSYLQQNENPDNSSLIFQEMLVDTAAEYWTGVLAKIDASATNVLSKSPFNRSVGPTTVIPLMAYAEAKLGRFAVAEARIAPTASDCYDCIITRARIAELQGQHARADYWFARAIHDAPSIPMAYADWGQALLERKQPDAAIAKFTLANRKGRHFADPLEMWGEALMAKNMSHLAVEKFEEANQYAPNWGRLHLKWGEALVYAGKPEEARTQFAIASGLDLVRTDKAELARVSGRG